MVLKLHISQKIITDYQGVAKYYSGINPNSLQLVVGTLPGVRQWPNYGNYINITDDVSDLHKLTLTSSLEHNAEGEITKGTINQKKSASGSLTVGGQAYQLIKKWLIDDVSAPFNAVKVKIEHVGCGYYEDYVIKGEDLAFCENKICVLNLVIKQADEVYNCFKSTLISDNWQGWFNSSIDPTDPNAKKHPRFSYCNRPNNVGGLLVQWYLMMTMFATSSMAIVGIFLAINPILAILNLIKNLLGANWNIPKPVTLDDIFDSFSSYFIESAGCGREHPAPLIRDYIQNVCSKCGIHVDEYTAPIFFNPVHWGESGHFMTSSGKDLQGTHNPHYNDCFMWPQTRKGVRRFKNMSPIGYGHPDDTTFFYPENCPLFTGDMFLDYLKGLYNAEWGIRNIQIGNKNVPALFFQRSDFYDTKTPVFDFSPGGADHNKIIDGICYEWNGNKLPAATIGIYTNDAADTEGNNAQSFMNGYISHGNTDDNPNFSGIKDVKQPIGATKFRLDGVDDDYIYNTLQLIHNGGFVTLLSVGAFMPWVMIVWQDTIDEILERFGDWVDYGLLLSDETTTLPKVLTWDGQSYTNAKAVKSYAGTSNNGPSPTPNAKYNNGVPWEILHPANTWVQGRNIPLGSQTYGAYEVRGYFGNKLAFAPAILVNYPMYFDPRFEGTLWDLYHWVDDPNRKAPTNRDWSLKIKLCCEDLQKLGVFGSPGNIKLGETVRLNGGFYGMGIITEITVSYDTSGIFGMYIELKGTSGG